MVLGLVLLVPRLQPVLAVFLFLRGVGLSLSAARLGLDGGTGRGGLTGTCRGGLTGLAAVPTDTGVL
ncbi:hypothetical protein SUDANB150_07651 [Streptomyces sp. enrichment culture]